MSLLELEADIQKDLDIMGEIIYITINNLVVPVKSIYGFSTVRLQDDSSFRAVIEQQMFNFYVSTLDVKTYGIVPDLSFYVQDSADKYTFTIMQRPVPCLDGWSRLACNLVMITPL